MGRALVDWRCRVNTSLTQVNWKQAPLSVGKDIFGMCARAELTFDEYLDATAVWTADSCHEYAPKLFVPLSSVLRTYCIDRSNQRGERMAETARLVGEWLQGTRERLAENTKDFETLSWALSKCVKHNNQSGIEKLNDAMTRFANGPKFPKDDFEMAMRCQQEDWRARKAQDGRKV